MRRLARKVFAGEPLADDYELHRSMVVHCKRRSRMAEAVQRDLDRRFMRPLRQVASVKTAADLALWWQERGPSQDLPGALWATLTHPRCTPAVEYHVLGQVHMVQHQVGMATRVELARFEALIDENAILARELARAQQRSTRQATEHADSMLALQADIVRQRGQAMAAHSAAALLREDLQALGKTLPDLEQRLTLTQRCAHQAQRLIELQRALGQARGEITSLRNQVRAREPVRETTGAAHAIQGPPEGSPSSADKLANRSVLCVGGRTASVPLYRHLIEGHGGHFLHHDGGEEHSAGQLESTLAAADLVICQAGCISHNAYWRVKDHCKRTGKRCVFVETPSASSLQRALAGIGSRP